MQMRRSFRFVLYIMIGFLIYEVIQSGDAGVTHSQVKNTLLIAMIVVFVLLLIVRVIKQRYDDGSEEQ